MLRSIVTLVWARVNRDDADVGGLRSLRRTEGLRSLSVAEETVRPNGLVGRWEASVVPVLVLSSSSTANAAEGTA